MKAIRSLLLTLLAAPVALLATPSGLDNIPTADVTPQGTWVLQTYSNFGDQHDMDFSVGFKSGLDFAAWGKLEFGADSSVIPSGGGQGGPVLLQFKYAHDLWQGATLAFGVANIALDSQDRDRAGDAFYYPVLTQKVGDDWFRVHVGYGWQHHGDSPILGLDKTFKVWDRDLMLCTDYIQIQNQAQWEGSWGIKYTLCKYVVFETWMSQPFRTGNPIFTAKLDFVFTF